MSARQLIVPGTPVVKSALALPAGATSTLFTASGAVLVTGLFGRVTTALGATATNLSLGTGGGGTSAIATPTAIASKAAGSWLLPGSTPLAALSAPVAPSVPATGVAAQNVNAYAVQVVISAGGATITNVSVNGLTVGAAAGTYTVPAFGSISIAYSVATPTWAWTNANAPGGPGPLLVTSGAPAFLEPVSPGTELPQMLSSFLCAQDTITWTTSATDTGAMSWYLWYVPLDNSATVS